MNALANALRVLLLVVMGLLLGSVWHWAPSTASWRQLFDDPAIVHIVKFSFVQAGLSTLASVGLGLIIAWAAAQGRFQVLRHTLALTTITPTLLYVLALLDITSLINQVAGTQLSLFGLPGIIVAHMALNAPLVALLMLPAMESMPTSYLKLKAMLGMSTWCFVYRVLWPVSRSAFWQATSLVFMLCFTSFTVLYVLAGQPSNANLELAIFAAVKYEFNLGLGAQLALLQGVLIIGLLALFSLKPTTAAPAVTQRLPTLTLASLAEAILLIVVLAPFAVMLVQSLSHLGEPVDGALINALINSVVLSLTVSVTATLLNLVWMSTLRQSRTVARLHEMLIHALYLTPVVMVCVGVYLLFKNIMNPFLHPWGVNFALLVIFIQPYLYKISLPAWQQHISNTDKLAQSLHLTSLQRLRYVDLPAMRATLGKVMGFASLIAMGDVAIISFFSNEDFQTISLYLAQQLSGYRQSEAWQTAGFFIGAAMLLWWLPSWVAHRGKRV